jgi:hypothetical protein
MTFEFEKNWNFLRILSPKFVLLGTTILVLVLRHFSYEVFLPCVMEYALQQLTRDQLRELCRLKGVPKSGNKQTLVKRLEDKTSLDSLDNTKFARIRDKMRIPATTRKEETLAIQEQMAKMNAVVIGIREVRYNCFVT